MEFSNVNTEVAKLQGNIGVARAIYEYTKKGFVVLTPLSDSSKYDLVVDMNGTLLKVQVKTSRMTSKSGGYVINLKTSGGNTSHNTIRKREDSDYDLLFVLTETGKCWSIPSKELGEARNSIVVGSKKYNEFLIG
jgi:hypothetical protein